MIEILDVIVRIRTKVDYNITAIEINENVVISF